MTAVKARHHGAKFRLEAAGPGEPPKLWSLRIYQRDGSWLVAARRYRSHRVWIASLADVVREAVRLGQRAHMEQQLGGRAR